MWQQPFHLSTSISNSDNVALLLGAHRHPCSKGRHWWKVPFSQALWSEKETSYLWSLEPSTKTFARSGKGTEKKRFPLDMELMFHCRNLPPKSWSTISGSKGWYLARTDAATESPSASLLLRSSCKKESDHLDVYVNPVPRKLGGRMPPLNWIDDAIENAAKLQLDVWKTAQVWKVPPRIVANCNTDNC